MEFPSTQWTQLARASLHGGPPEAEALAAFCGAYRAPVLGYLLMRGLSREDAEDIVQSFLLFLMERSTLKRADRDRGRFRSFLLGTLRNFLHDRQQRNEAARRGGGTRLLPLDTVAEQLAADNSGAEEEFDRHWALTILRRSLAAVEAQRPRELFAAVRAYLPGGGVPPPFAEVSRATGMTEQALRKEVSRVRALVRQTVRAEVARTVDSPAEIEAEMAWLHRVLRGQ